MNRDYVVELFKQHVDEDTAEVLVTLLEEDGLLSFRQNKSNPEINTVLEVFKEAFGTTRSGRYDRFAAQRLIKKYDTGQVCRVIKALASRQGERYCPTVGSVSQLEEKWVSVGRFLTKQSDVQDIA